MRASMWEEVWEEDGGCQWQSERWSEWYLHAGKGLEQD